MSSLRDKNLLLLGILSMHSVHGYQLNEFLQAPTNAIQIGKANAYRLLEQLEQKGWVTHKEEREGMRPPRQVYSITPQGQAEFDRLLRERLAEHEPGEHPDGVSLNFIGALKPKKAGALLKRRLELLEARFAALDEFPSDVRAAHPGLDYLIRQSELERDFISGLVKRLKRKNKGKANPE